MNIESEQIRKIACRAVFGSALVQNAYRGLVAEAIVASALTPTWRWCSGDWAPWDFERRDGLRLEVKQSAVRQTWSRDDSRPTPGRFDIGARLGRFDGDAWIDKLGRNAQIYVFAQHIVAGDGADHCDPAQWRFYVLSETQLPLAKTIGLNSIAKLATAIAFNELRSAVEEISLGAAAAISLNP